MTNFDNVVRLIVESCKVAASVNWDSVTDATHVHTDIIILKV